MRHTYAGSTMRKRRSEPVAALLARRAAVHDLETRTLHSADQYSRAKDASH